MKEICDKTRQVAVMAGQFIKGEYGNMTADKVDEKGLHNLVTYVDKESEEMIIRQLSEILPEAGFIAEESDNRMAEEYNWVIDPLDGTTNFIHGLPPFAVSIALRRKEEAVLGVVYEVALDECFYAWEDGPAFMNGKEIHVSETPDISHSLVATGFPYQDFQKQNEYMALLDNLMRSSRGVRRLGSAATDLAYVACGRFDFFYEYGLNAWDIAAGAFIVQQAGGMNSDFHGGKNYTSGIEIISSNGILHKEALTKIAGYMNK